MLRHTLALLHLDVSVSVTSEATCALLFVQHASYHAVLIDFLYSEACVFLMSWLVTQCAGGAWISGVCWRAAACRGHWQGCDPAWRGVTRSGGG